MRRSVCRLGSTSTADTRATSPSSVWVTSPISRPVWPTRPRVASGQTRGLQDANYGEGRAAEEVVRGGLWRFGTAYVYRSAKVRPAGNAAAGAARADVAAGPAAGGPGHQVFRRFRWRLA